MLNLSICKNISDDGIKNLRNLHTLNLSGCEKITDGGIKNLIKKIKKLKESKDILLPKLMNGTINIE